MEKDLSPRLLSEASTLKHMIICPTDIAILMATYNGEKYLREQLESILTQTHQDWHLYVHDDGSKDNTISVVKNYIERFPDKITFMEYPSQGGACKNFLSLLERIDSNYYMFCDQDDVWLPEKIEKAYESIAKIEGKEPNHPIIINTDLTVVDSHKEIISPSFWKYEHIYPMWISHYNDHAALHYVTGCTMLFNKEAKKVIKRPCDKATMHDTWIALSVAAAGGIIYNLYNSYILYRQHEDNTLGAQDARSQTIFHKFRHFREVLLLNIKHFEEMNAIKELSIWNYIIAKIRYKKFIQKEIKKIT